MSRTRVTPVPCQETDPDIFFPDIPLVTGMSSRYVTQAAKKICQSCWFQSGCLDLALSIGDVWGIWGGKTRQQRRGIARNMGLELRKYYAEGKSMNEE